MSPKSPDAYDAVVGRNIRFTRLAKGLPQSGLARGLGVTFQQLQKYESGTNRVGVGRLVRIAQALDVSVTALLAGIVTGGCASRAPRQCALRAPGRRETPPPPCYGI